MGLYDVNPTELILKVATELKKEKLIVAPPWAPFVRTGLSRERQPTQTDWWHIRSAAILRKIMVLGPIGTQKLRRHYGGRKNRGMKPDKFFPASGNIIRTILQQLEKSGLAKQVEKETHKGRVITPKGHKLISSVSTQILKQNPPAPIKRAVAPKAAPAKVEQKPAEEKIEKKAEAKTKPTKKDNKKE